MKTKVTLVGLAVFALASLPIQAAATEDLILSDSSGDTITVDQSGNYSCVGTCTKISASGGGGDITFVGTIGTFTFDLDSGQAAPLEALPNLMNTTTTNISSTGAGTLTVTFSEVGYTSFASTLAETASDSYSSFTATGSTATLNGYDNALNTLNSTSNPIGTVLASTDTTTSLQSDSNTQDYANTAGSSGSLTEVLALNFAGAGQIETNFLISNVAVPEPTSIVLLGSILLALAGLFGRQLAKRA